MRPNCESTTVTATRFLARLRGGDGLAFVVVAGAEDEGDEDDGDGDDRCSSGSLPQPAANAATVRARATALIARQGSRSSRTASGPV